MAEGDRERVTLVLTAGPDPMQPCYGVSRDLMYRVKLLLKRAKRDLGLIAVQVRDTKPSEADHAVPR